MDPGGDDQQFWLSGTLRVFAMEQVEQIFSTILNLLKPVLNFLDVTARCPGRGSNLVPAALVRVAGHWLD